MEIPSSPGGMLVGRPADASGVGPTGVRFVSGHEIARAGDGSNSWNVEEAVSREGSERDVPAAVSRRSLKSVTIAPPSKDEEEGGGAVIW